MEVAFAYQQRTRLSTALTSSALDFAVNLHRPPVAFQGQVKEPLLLRQLMIALQEVIVSDFEGLSYEEWLAMLDPVITVHHDQIFFEAFSNDKSSYARLSAPLNAFEAQGQTNYGTTNIDFTYELRHALQHMRTSRRTIFAVGLGGFGVTTEIGTLAHNHVERKVDLPESWLKGFLQVQAAFTMRPWLVEARPVDLLNIITHLLEHRAKRSPRALRYELVPGEPIRVVLEPWEKVFTLAGTHYTGYARKVRLWGRKRLTLLQHVLPYADRVTVAILGRGLPSFYTCHCGDYQFVLALSGWTANDWSEGGAFELLAPAAAPDADQMAIVYNALVQHLAADQARLESDTALPRQTVEHTLFQLCRAGRAMYDPTTKHYRLRELFHVPLKVEELFQPNPRLLLAQQMYQQGTVTLQIVEQPDPQQAQRRETRATAVVQEGTTSHKTLITLDGIGRLRYGRCTCPFFEENLMGRGPCAHMLAVRLALEHATIAKELLPESPA